MRTKPKSHERSVKSKRVGAVLTGRATVVSRRELGSVDETAYLLGTRANAEHLRQSIEHAEFGMVEEHDLR